VVLSVVKNYRVYSPGSFMFICVHLNAFVQSCDIYMANVCHIVFFVVAEYFRLRLTYISRHCICNIIMNIFIYQHLLIATNEKKNQRNISFKAVLTDN